MQTLLELLITFIMIGAVSFGGGYAMIPLMEREIVTNHGWMTLGEFTEIIAVAGMSPGPIATNSAIFVGYERAGLGGAAVSALGMVLPSLVIILIVSLFFYKVQRNVYVKSMFYGLRPVITGLIIYAAIRFAIGNGVISSSISWDMLWMFIICLVSFVAMWRWNVHPVLIILFSGIVGAAIFT